MTTNEKLRLISEGLREHQERQLEIFIQVGRVAAVVIVVSLVCYVAHKYVFPKAKELVINIFGSKSKKTIKK